MPPNVPERSTPPLRAPSRDELVIAAAEAAVHADGFQSDVVAATASRLRRTHPDWATAVHDSADGYEADLRLVSLAALVRR